MGRTALSKTGWLTNQLRRIDNAMISRSTYQPDMGLRALNRPRLWSMVALLFIAAGAWAYTVLGVGMPMSAITMSFMPSDMAMPLPDWTPMRALLMFAMWWVMMIAMMIPSAIPMIFLYDRVASRIKPADRHVGLFVLGYIVIWGGFSFAATMLHAAGEWSGLINGMMASASGYLGAALLMGAGIWQFTDMKFKCLEACRSPAEFLSRIWRSGGTGALRMGVAHGIYCVGCCWALMLLLFYGGVMNLYWIVGLSVFVVLEKILPYSPVVARLTGVALIGSGLIVFAQV